MIYSSLNRQTFARVAAKRQVGLSASLILRRRSGTSALADSVALMMLRACSAKFAADTLLVTNALRSLSKNVVPDRFAVGPRSTASVLCCVAAALVSFGQLCYLAASVISHSTYFVLQQLSHLAAAMLPCTPAALHQLSCAAAAVVSFSVCSDFSGSAAVLQQLCWLTAAVLSCGSHALLHQLC